MKKVVIGVVIVLVIAAIIGAIVMFGGKSGNSNIQTGIKVQTVEEMQKVFNDINTKLGEEIPRLEVREVDITDEFAFTSTTGLKSNANVEAVVASEPLMSAQAFSAVMIKVSDDANIEEMKKEILDNLDMRKWICVSAEKLRVTNYGNVIFFVMSSEEWGKPVYDEFKQTVGGKIGTELEKTGEI